MVTYNFKHLPMIHILHAISILYPEIYPLYPISTIINRCYSTRAKSNLTAFHVNIKVNFPWKCNLIWEICLTYTDCYFSVFEYTTKWISVLNLSNKYIYDISKHDFIDKIRIFRLKKNHIIWKIISRKNKLEIRLYVAMKVNVFY